MQAKARTTVLVLGAAGVVSAAALFLDHNRAEGGAVEPAHAAEQTSCGTAAPSRANTKLDHGTLGASLSAGMLMRGAGGEVQAAFDLTTERASDAQRAPLDLAFVVDHSGSMSDGRLDHAKSAAHGIVDHLTAADHIALIQFDDTAQVVVPSIAMDGEGKAKFGKALDAMQPAGGTNLHAGLVLGRQEAQRAYTQGQVSRVILLSDGHANEGITATPEIADAARDAANHGVRITAVGIGLDFNEDLMEAIAEAGRGNYHYVKEASDLDKVIAGELAGVQATVATNVELRLRPACAGAQIVAVHGYESRRDGGAVVVPMADLIGGDSRKLLVSMKVPDSIAGSIGALHAELVYRDAKGGEVRTRALDLGVTIGTDAKLALASVDQDVMAQVMKQQASDSMRQAAQAYERGDADAAVRILDSTQHELDKKATAYKIAPAKSAPAFKGIGDMSAKAKAYKPGSDEGKDMLKQSKQSARIMSKKGMSE
jgi:Ca-activated chloride channel family protein